MEFDLHQESHQKLLELLQQTSGNLKIKVKIFFNLSPLIDHNGSVEM